MRAMVRGHGGFTKRAVRTLLTAAAALALGGCSNLGYYAHAASGHLRLMAGAEPIDELIAQGDLPPERRSRLRRVEAIRAFAAERLALPVGDAYESFIDPGREHVVWNVFAAPALALELREWCHPIVGCVPYRGYFDEERARGFAEGLREHGLDVHVTGVAAYSTVGWFPDPVTTPMLAREDHALAGLIFHELAHRRVWIDGAAALNEAFAVVVQREGVRRWLGANAGAAERRAWRAARVREAAFERLVAEARERLGALYASDRDAAAKRAAKAEILADVRERAHASDALAGPGGAGYRKWFDDLNNARLGAAGVYRHRVPALEALLREHDGDLPAFYEAVESLGELNASSREARLKELAAEAAPRDQDQGARSEDRGARKEVDQDNRG